MRAATFCSNAPLGDASFLGLMMKKRSLSLCIAALMGLAYPVAHATPFTITTNGLDAGSNGSETTSAIDSLVITDSLATLMYFGNPQVAGTRVVSTNVQSVLDAEGFVTGLQTTVSGNTVTSAYPAAPGGLNIDAFNLAGNPVADLNGFAASGGDWGLTYSYMLEGKSLGGDGSGVNYTDGYIDLIYQDGSPDGIFVLRLDVNGSSANGNTVFGSLDFSGVDTNNLWFAETFFSVAAPGGLVFFDDPQAITWQLAFDGTPTAPTDDELFEGAFSGSGDGALFRQILQSGKMTYNIPEPSSLALAGLVLTGVFAASRRRKSA
jgi:PEP-CTERM motif